METNARPTTMPSNIPKTLRLVVEVPTVKKSSDITLEVTASNVVVEVPEKYYLDMPLPYEIESEKGNAQFDKTKQVLTLELPVVPKAPDPNAVSIWGRSATEVDEGDDKEQEDDGGLDELRGEEEEEEPLPPLEDTNAPPASEPVATDSSTPEPEVAPQEGPPSSNEDAVQGPPSPSAAEDDRREKLESKQGGLLRIAKEEPEVKKTIGDVLAEAEAEDPVEDQEQYPAFTPSETFTGARPGYCFKLGDEGLGYYRDLKQPRPRGGLSVAEAKEKPLWTPQVVPGQKPEDSRASDRSVPFYKKADYDAPPSEAWIKEVDTSEVQRAASSFQPPSRKPLPEQLRRYIDRTALLSTRLPHRDVASEVGTDLELDWRQTRQNLILLARLPAAQEVADVQLALVGRRLTVAFCVRPVADAGDSSVRWQRYRLRRTLCGLVDPRQWHCELPVPGAAVPRLALILRKVDQDEPWEAAFDTSAGSTVASVEEAELDAAAAAAAEAGAANGDAVDDSAGLDVADGLGAGAADDSAELDVAAPLVSTGSVERKAAAAPVSASAAAAMAQSATVMGQAVLLKNRLMYQLM
eukprot:gnl/TRDRNA2_/TRDRNA2_39854_c0_seq1.p1 gnl/TRDRNA2_/TRDRNA2_39854_c0~~gnl/TRDRNA2_/TRDRNA2_39854_c0_seq1.p1  ORF type:complete len:674 (-),score=181.31 gnl/TRDRNA2_/TRDRNA2_39854_c0_seq1:66-1805(-)